MKALKKLLYILPLAGLMATSCTDVENIEVEHIGGYNTLGDSEYYANLRAYKQTMYNYGRPVAFGWYSNWAPAGTYRRGYLTSMPDSMDFVSMWSGCPNRYQITPEQKADKEFVQKVKGTKLLEVSLMSYLGKGRTPDYVYAKVDSIADEEGWDDSKRSTGKKLARWKFWGFDGQVGSQNHKDALKRFAHALCDSLFTSEWDGFDFDWEIGIGVFDMDGTLQTNDDLIYLIKEMNEYEGPNGGRVGPKHDPDGKGHKLICIDGNFGGFIGPLKGYVDYYIIQAYGGYANFDGYDDPRQIIACANFESGAASGNGIMNLAKAMPSVGYKGGVGAFRFDNDYDNTPDYKWMRQAIRVNQEVFNAWKEQQEQIEQDNQESAPETEK